MSEVEEAMEAISEEQTQQVIQQIIAENEEYVRNRNDDQIKEILGLTIAMVYILDESSAVQNDRQFIIQNVVLSSETVQELNQFKVQMYLALIERINAFLDIKDSQRFKDYMSALEELWKECLEVKGRAGSSDTEDQAVSELVEEMRFHKRNFRRFLTQISFLVKGLELICGDSERQSSDFVYIFGEDICLRRLRAAYEYFNECNDRFIDRLNQLIN